MAETANAFLMLPAVILAFLCTFSLEQRRTPILCAAAGLPFLVLCLFILETVPAAWAVLLLIGALALAFLTQSIRRESGRAACRLSALLALPLAALIGLLVLISPPEAYERGAWQESLQSSVSSALDKLSLFRMDHKTGQMELVSPFSPSTLGSRVWDSSVERVIFRALARRARPAGTSWTSVRRSRAPIICARTRWRPTRTAPGRRSPRARMRSFPCRRMPSCQKRRRLCGRWRSRPI